MVLKSLFEKIMQAQIPLPTFEDNLKLLQFWIDQENKWFYFETEIIQSSSLGEEEVPAQRYQVLPERAIRTQTKFYVQSRIVGKIHDVIFNPPSMMLHEVKVITVRLNFDNNRHTVISEQERDRYGLVFSQITYFEPIDNIDNFHASDERIK